MSFSIYVSQIDTSFKFGTEQGFDKLNTILVSTSKIPDRNLVVFFIKGQGERLSSKKSFSTSNMTYKLKTVISYIYLFSIIVLVTQR